MFFDNTQFCQISYVGTSNNLDEEHATQFEGCIPREIAQYKQNVSELQPGGVGTYKQLLKVQCQKYFLKLRNSCIVGEAGTINSNAVN